jgi:hypothetical protein
VSDAHSLSSDHGDVLVLNHVPASTLQAIYHAVTGKTENLEKRFTKNFVVRKRDLDQLYLKVLQQLEHFERIAGPTVTIKVSFHNGENQQFSSWERFKIFDSGKIEIVSDVVIKFEFIITLPESLKPQRYIINIDIDSRLPVVSDGDNDSYALFRFMRLDEIPSLHVSIDFIDYLCAKNFMQIVEDWFNTLEESPRWNWGQWFGMSLPFTWRNIFTKFANVGAASFIALYAYLKGGALGDAAQIVYLGAVAIIIWTVCNLICSTMGNRFESVLSKKVIPATILLTVGDERAFDRIKKRAGTVVPKMTCYIFGTLGTLLLNVIAGFIYAWITR